MKKPIALLIIITCITHAAIAQSWVWGKRGGSADDPIRHEGIYNLATDSHKNIYGLSYVGSFDLNVDGNPKSGMPIGANPTDAALVSFACDGSYRWSKILKGYNYDEKFTGLQTDAQDNVYVTGYSGGGGDGGLTNYYPVSIDNDIIFPQYPITDELISFLAKYNSSGVLQWLKRIRPPSTSFSDTVIYWGLSTDAAGNSYGYACLSAGTYCDGALTVTGTGTGYKRYILKYDTNGNFINATYIDINTNYGGDDRYFRNPNNGNYYFYYCKTNGIESSAQTAVIGGQAVVGNAVLSCFDNTGQFLWKREDTATDGELNFNIWNIEFDTNNDIYMSTQMNGLNSDSFLGFTIPGFVNRIVVMKVNSDVSSIVWTSQPNHNCENNTGGFALKANEVAMSNYCFGTYTWGTQSMYVNGINQGLLPLLARLDKTTGACIGLSHIQNGLVTDDHGNALVADASGDYIMGGDFGSQMTFDNGTVYSEGGPTDFFIAKYSTTACSPLAVEENQKPKLGIYPNPVENIVHVNTSEKLQFTIYTINGAMIKKGILSEDQNTIDLSNVLTGSYILETINAKGEIYKEKLLKN